MAARRSTPALIIEFVTEASALLRGMAQLCRSELGEKISHATRAVAFIAVAVVLLIATLVLFLIAAVGGLTALGLQLYWSALIVGVVVGVVGAALLFKALANLKPANLKPRKALAQIHKLFLAAQGQAEARL